MQRPPLWVSDVPTDAPTLPATGTPPPGWWTDELLAALTEALAAVRAFVDANERSRRTDLTAVDSADLRVQAQVLLQAAGALEATGRVAEARTVAALQGVLDRLVARPLAAEAELLPLVERGVWALQDQLRRDQQGRALPGLALFPYYRDWRQWARERAHPADLWDPALPATVEAPRARRILPGPRVRRWLERLSLPLLREGRSSSAQALARLAGGLARAAADPAQARFWLIATAVFEGAAARRLTLDVWAKRGVAAMLRLAAPVHGVIDAGGAGWDVAAREWLFLAARIDPPPDESMPYARALWRAMGWTTPLRWDPEQRRLGQVDPSRVAHARTVAQRWWELALTEGSSAERRRAVTTLVDAMAVLPNPWPLLSSAWRQWVDEAGAAAVVDAAPLQAALGTRAELEAVDPLDGAQAQRLCALAERLQNAVAGGAAAESEPWLIQPHRLWAEREGAPAVAAAWRAGIGSIQQALEGGSGATGGADPQVRALLQRLQALVGLAEWLGWEPVADALRDGSAGLAAPAGGPVTGEGAKAGGTTWGRLRSVLGAVARWVDAWAQDPQQAMRRHGPAGAWAGPGGEGVAGAEDTAADEVAPVAEPADGEDDGLDERAIFLQEATELLAEWAQSMDALRDDTADRAALGRVRRIVHALKGGARLVGLEALGEAAGGVERRLNAWLAEDHAPEAAQVDGLEAVCAALVPWVQGWIDAGAVVDEGARLAAVEGLLRRLDGAEPVVWSLDAAIAAANGVANGTADRVAEAPSCPEDTGRPAIPAPAGEGWRLSAPPGGTAVPVSAPVPGSSSVPSSDAVPDDASGPPPAWLVAADARLRAHRQVAATRVWWHAVRAEQAGHPPVAVPAALRRAGAQARREAWRQRCAADAAFRAHASRLGWLTGDAIGAHVCATRPVGEPEAMLAWRWAIADDVVVEPALLERLAPVLLHLAAVAGHAASPAAGAIGRAGAASILNVCLRAAPARGALIVDLSHDGAPVDWQRLRDEAVRLGLHAAPDPFTPDDAIRCALALTGAGPVNDDPWAAVGLGDAGVVAALRALAAQATCVTPAAGGSGWRLVVPVALSLVAVTVVRMHGQTVGLLATAVEAETRVSARAWADAQRVGAWRDAQGSAWPVAPVAWPGAASHVAQGEAARVTVVTCRGVGQRAAWAVDAVLDHRVVWLDPAAAVDATGGAGGTDMALPGYVGTGRCADGTALPVLHPLAGV